MDKIIQLFAVVQMVADAVNPELGDKMRTAVKDVQDEMKKPDFIAHAIDWAKHHGNRPGTPESRGEKA